MKHAAIACLAFLMVVTAAPAQNSTPETQHKTPPTIDVKTAGMQKLPGFFTYYWDAREGKLCCKSTN